MFKSKKELTITNQELNNELRLLKLDKERLLFENKQLYIRNVQLKEISSQDFLIDELEQAKQRLESELEESQDREHDLKEDYNTLYKSHLDAQAKKEKLETQNVILKAANEVLSGHNANIQKIMDDNVALEAEVKSLKDKIAMKDEMLETEGTAYTILKEDNDKLLDAIIKFQTKEVQIVQPSLIQPTILSSKTE